MATLYFGDLARSFQSQRLTTQLKTDMTRLSKELSTGLKADLGASLAGDFGPYAGLERSLKSLSAYHTSNLEASGMYGAMQIALENVQNTTQTLSSGLLQASSSRDSTLIASSSDDARQKLEIVVSSINTSVANRSLFAGAATDAAPIASASDIMSALGTEIAAAGATTVTDVVAVVDAWFDDVGGGFETTGYQGSQNDMGPLMIAEGETLNVDTRADDQSIRNTLKSFALASLISDGIFTGSASDKADLTAVASQRMLGADDGITELRSHIGAQEARIENAKARNAAEQSAYELARNELTAADPYQTASEFQAVYSQLQTLYTATARIASLKFTDYMR
jgi:flagellar hook-associated protein 3 FlgL